MSDQQINENVSNEVEQSAEPTKLEGLGADHQGLHVDSEGNVVNGTLDEDYLEFEEEEPVKAKKLDFSNFSDVLGNYNNPMSQIYKNIASTVLQMDEAKGGLIQNHILISGVKDNPSLTVPDITVRRVVFKNKEEIAPTEVIDGYSHQKLEEGSTCIWHLRYYNESIKFVQTGPTIDDVEEVEIINIDDYYTGDLVRYVNHYIIAFSIDGSKFADEEAIKLFYEANEFVDNIFMGSHRGLSTMLSSYLTMMGADKEDMIWNGWDNAKPLPETYRTFVDVTAGDNGVEKVLLNYLAIYCQPRITDPATGESAANEHTVVCTTRMIHQSEYDGKQYELNSKHLIETTYEVTDNIYGIVEAVIDQVNNKIVEINVYAEEGFTAELTTIPDM